MPASRAQTVKILAERGKERVLIVRRFDGWYAVRAERRYGSIRRDEASVATGASVASGASTAAW